MQQFDRLENFLRNDLGFADYIPLHTPTFDGSEKDYLLACLESTFVSTVGAYVIEFEEKVAALAGCKYGVATVNGTAALHAALHVLGAGAGDVVLCPSITFVATANAVKYTGARPVFLDSELETYGMSPVELKKFFTESCSAKNGSLYYKEQRVAACVVVDIFGHPAGLEEIEALCQEFGVALVEDSTESLGSHQNGRKCGSFGDVGVFSFNGNKIITTGGGGMITTNDEKLAARLKHVTTTARVADGINFSHDELGFNYRLPNLNAALGLGQLEDLADKIEKKRKLARAYSDLFSGIPGVAFRSENPDNYSNYWLQAIKFESKKLRDEFLEAASGQKLEVRPVWTPMHQLPFYSDCDIIGPLAGAMEISDTVVNIPSAPWLLD